MIKRGNRNKRSQNSSLCLRPKRSFLNKRLIWAASRGRVRLIKILLRLGADLHFDRDGALRWAAGKGYLRAVRYLVECGSKVHTDFGNALWYACLNGHLPVVKYLLQKNLVTTPLEHCVFASAARGNLLTTQYLILEHGYDVGEALSGASGHVQHHVVAWLKQYKAGEQAREESAKLLSGQPALSPSVGRRL